MTVRLTLPGKQSLLIETPVMNATGTLGFGDNARDLIALEKLGAFVTNPITYAPRTPANGTRVVPLDAGLLLHTGLPNDGVRKTVDTWGATWARMPIPVIVHLATGSGDELRRCLAVLDEVDSVSGVEIGVQDEITLKDVTALLKSARETDKPLIFRLPFDAPLEYAKAALSAGISGLTVCAPPRGTARDSGGKLVAGRLYGTWIKPLVLRLVGQIARAVNAPVIAAGGIHSAEDARDYLEAGAVAVQVDAAAWARPRQLEMIARDLGGLVITQPSGALPDEWFPGMGETLRQQQNSTDTTREG
jgi:dihydroorotate dehydrogenase (NAD+) catalytic subunit